MLFYGTVVRNNPDGVYVNIESVGGIVGPAKAVFDRSSLSEGTLVAMQPIESHWDRWIVVGTIQ